MPTEKPPLDVTTDWKHDVDFALIRRRYVVPRWFTAQVRIGEVQVELGIEVDDHGHARCRELRVQTDTAWARELRTPLLTDDDADISGEVLRDLPVARIKRAALSDVMTKVGKLPDGSLAPAITTQADRDEFYRDFATGMRPPRKGAPLNDQHLRDVAERYRAALEHGDPPTQTIADQYPVPVARSTVAKWVMKARERGFLGPALRGKAGEGTS